ncbi:MULTISPECIES: bifunctional sugar phosphate isomerase/epimerase/4-hydroxyphenylpyruvate dioxygenase family protein [unclassified Mesorhizobium]|uniref:bifunctional sugar phosphate isomerase/epimerase/4-hydroxyphenylpyruvate dioxygenase family protein n=1 Tax=unclassified Mesorhizobium TaxID=325217 RepID=UPI000A0480C6|nr:MULTISPECIES: sugar phosphate isomerase/epimerase and 4-hydroxyphenylpyruvate domain-containing protein [unclassified Mesorhizobium]WJI50355.1 sugar phosphate isomerase/epimerase and 4-hydroxyphenylpyruvate domain-containing protein [Mesorhizobium sp. C089B]
MKTSISTLSINGDFADKLAAAASAGFSGIEIGEQDFLSHGGTAAEMGGMVRDHGLTIDLIVPVVDFEGMPEPLRRKAFDRMERRFDIMADLGTNLMLIGSTIHPDALGGVDRMAADFAQLAARAAARELRIGYEARAWGRHISDYRDAWEVVRRAAHPAVGLVLDSFHILARGLSPESIRAIPGDRIFHVQLADAPRIAMDLDYKSHHFRCLPGEGDLPLVDFLRAVAATGYTGSCSIETPNNGSRGGERATARDAHRALSYIADQAWRAESTGWLDQTAMPPRSRLEGVEFVEFTASPDETQTLGKLLQQLGFARVAQHVSKAVSLWRQTGINIVINSEQKGYAHSAYVMHGTSVCDIGLMVEDATATAVRARAFGANDFTQARGAGELAIPAVRGVGGSVLHFLDRKSELSTVWETEFRSLPPDPQARPVGLRRIDHVAQVMKQEELLTWTLLYTAVFEFGKAPVVNVADPGGIVDSRALQSDDGAVRFTLNGVDTHRTFAGRFVSDSYGSSVQHLAFSTDDILATAGRLAGNGFDSLPVPDGYYAEIEAEFDLASEFVAQLAAANLFYDEDGRGGSYLQLYSYPFGDGFFFEVIERRGGYDGYGARNAAYRTAAQKRFLSGREFTSMNSREDPPGGGWPALAGDESFSQAFISGGIRRYDRGLSGGPPLVFAAVKRTRVASLFGVLKSSAFRAFRFAGVAHLSRVLLLSGIGALWPYP